MSYKCTNVFDDIKFDVVWSSDIELSRLLNNYYSFYDPIYSDIPTMKCKIMLYIDIWRDYLNHWWRTMNYAYNPIENYAMSEQGSAANQDIGDSDVTNRNYSNANNESKNTAGAKSHTDTTNRSEHYLTRSGNIGVTTSQQMIQSERDLISNINLKLIHIFEPLFYFTL